MGRIIDRSETLVKECSRLEEIVKKIADAGIVGLGGMLPYAGQGVLPHSRQSVIINARVQEPYLTADHQLMRNMRRNHGRCIHSDEGCKGEQRSSALRTTSPMPSS